MFKGAIVIPARYESSRFPGKPLAKINEKPMIQHVYEKCVVAIGKKLVYVATDNDDIRDVVESFGGQVVMTSPDCITGTDRLAEANESLDLDFIVNVQGDEPMISSEDVRLVFDRMTESSENILCCYCNIEEHEINMPTVPKVVVSESNRLIYMSRGGCPFDKKGSPKARYKQVCIYGFGRNHLKVFKNNASKTINEIVEDIEILRFIDLDYSVVMLKVPAGGVAVDTPEDLQRVIALMHPKYT